MKNAIYTGLIFFLFGNIVAWFQYNNQFVWSWWEDKPLFTNLVFSPFVGLCFWYGTRNIVSVTNELWPSKLLAFGVSNFVFAVMTYVFMKESMFSAKTLTCLFLAGIIILIQLFWK